jgi:hypothetical protein
MTVPGAAVRGVVATLLAPPAAVAVHGAGAPAFAAIVTGLTVAAGGIWWARRSRVMRGSTRFAPVRTSSRF